MPGGDHFVTFDGGDRRGFVNFLLADAGRVHVGFVRQVHQVVDHQAVVAADMKQPAAVGPFIADGPLQVMDQVGIGFVLFARPYPDKPVALDHSKGLVAGEAANALAGHLDGLAVATHHQAVVAAHQVAVVDIPQRERGTAMRAKVFNGRDFVFQAAIKNHLFTANLPTQRLIGDFVGGAGDIPRIFWIHTNLQIRCYCFYGSIRRDWSWVSQFVISY